MKLPIKKTYIAMVIMLFSLVAMIKGCGKSLNGGACGGCPDTTAPLGSSVVAPSLSAGTISSTGGACYQAQVFRFLDSAGNPLNNICVEITTNGLMALHSDLFPANCDSVRNDPQTYIRTRTNNSGIVVLDFVSSCSGFASGTTSINAFVTAQSCGVAGTATAAITVSSPGCQ